MLSVVFSSDLPPLSATASSPGSGTSERKMITNAKAKTPMAINNAGLASAILVSLVISPIR